MTARLDIPISLDDVMADLGYGRGPETAPPARLPAPVRGSLPRPTLGGGRFRRAYLEAELLGRIHPRLARRALLRLWLTAWVHPSALRPVVDMPPTLEEWSLPAARSRVAGPLRGWAGGHGATAVLVHGWAGRGADWRHLAGDLIDAGWRVVAPDLPAHGLTTGERTDLFVLGRALAAVFEAERPALVVTHSMGFPATMVALERGAFEPQRIVALAPGRKIARAVDGFAARMKFPLRLLDELRRGIEADYGSDVWEVLDVDRVLGDLAPSGLVIHDVDDDEVPVTDARHIASQWRGAELVETAGLGHRRILRDEAVRRLVVATAAA